MQHSQPSSKMATMTHSHLFSIEPIPRAKNSSPNSPIPNVGPISINPNYTLTITPKLPNPPVSLFFQSPNSNGGDGSRGRGHSHRPLPMKLNAATISLLSPHAKTPLSLRPRSLMATSVTQTVTLALPSDAPVMEPDEDSLCSKHPGDEGTQQFSSLSTEPLLGSPTRCLSGESRVERAWAHWRKLGQPRLIVAPMVDNSELPFRMLCRKYGAEAAYTPMLHSRLFSESEKYRAQEFSTCKEDRPLFVQFCANDPDVLLEAAQRVEPYCDYVDINLGCPQRIAKRGNYGAFLMDNLPLVKSLVENLAHNLHVPVSCKIRVFPDLEDTISYARMLEDAGCSLLAVHGRKRDEKDQKKVRADWKAIKAVKDALRIPVLANGNIRHMDDVQTCLEETGADGVLSADSLLENPALFAGYRTAEWVVGNEASHEDGKLDQADLLVEYLNLCEQYPVPWRMIRAHVHKMMGEWFRIHPHVREDLNAQNKLTFEFLYNMVDQIRELDARIPLYTKNSHAANISANETAA